MALSTLLVPLLVFGLALDARADERDGTSAQDRQRSLDRIRIALDQPQPEERLVLDYGIVKRARLERTPVQTSRDSVWNGVLIGGGIGALGGYFWARDICGGTDDTECFIISAPVGMLAGFGIGALVGGIVDAVHK